MFDEAWIVWIYVCFGAGLLGLGMVLGMFLMWLVS